MDFIELASYKVQAFVVCNGLWIFGNIPKAEGSWVSKCAPLGSRQGRCHYEAQFKVAVVPFRQ